MPKANAQIRRILLVDNNPRQRDVMVAHLKWSFPEHECIATGTYDEAMEAIHLHGATIEACLLDWRLDGKDDGRETLTAIRNLKPRLPVLVFTASEDVGKEAYAAGASFYIPKPLEVSLVTRCVHALMTMNSLVRQNAESERQNTLLTRANELMVHLNELALEIPTQLRSDVADSVAEFLHANLLYSRVRIYLLNGAKACGTASRGMPTGFDIRQYTIDENNPHAVRAFEQGSPIMISADEFKHDRFFQEFDNRGVRHQLMVPLVSPFGKVGLIAIDDKPSTDRKIRELDSDDVKVMSVASAVIAGAIQAAKARKERERENQWIRGLLEIDKVLTTSPSVEKVLQSVIDTLTGSVKADVGIVMTRRGKSSPLHVVASAGAPRDIFRVSHNGTYGLIGKCLDEGRQVIARHVQDNDLLEECVEPIRFREIWIECFKGAKTVVVAPVSCGDVRIGVLVLGFSTTDTLSKIDLCYLDDVARRIAIALAKLDEAQRLEAALIQKAKLSDLAMLTAGISHGIRNPLQTILAATEAGKSAIADLEQVPLSQSALELNACLDITSKNLTCAFELINRLVRWATPQGSMVGGAVYIDVIIKDLTELVRDVFREKGIQLLLELPPSVPAIAASIDGIRVAFDDLVWNAAKAMPEGGILTISISVDHAANTLAVKFSDTGVGISQEQIERLFAINPFQPLPPGGRGLGIYLARKVVESAGGTIECSSVINQGTTFLVAFPIQQPTPKLGVSQ